MPTFHYQVQDEQKAVQIEPDADGYQVTIGDNVYCVLLDKQTEETSHFTMDGQKKRVHVAIDGKSNERVVWFAGKSWRLEKVDPRRKDRRGSAQAESGALIASMPGQVREILVAEGESVAKGDPLVVVEAMKMETRMLTQVDGVVTTLNCAVGDVVERGQVLVVVG